MRITPPLPKILGVCLIYIQGVREYVSPEV